MEYTRVYKDGDESVETFSSLSKHDPRNWANAATNRDVGWSDSNEVINRFELDSFSGSETGSDEFDISKITERDEWQKLDKIS